MVAKEHQGWLMIVYRVPSTPSTSRITIWKKAKELGALPLQQSVYILPNSPSLKEALIDLKEQILQLGGECKLVEAALLGEDQEKEVIAGLNELRTQEYTEVLEGCEELVQQLDKESKAGKFHFAEWEENDKRLKRLREWFNSVVGRDFFTNELQAEASKMMRECEGRFETFSREVFAHEGINPEDKKIERLTGMSGSFGKEEKEKQRQVYRKDELILRMHDIISRLEGNVLEIGENKVSALSESAVLGLEYKDRKGRKSLKFKIEWPPSPVPDKEADI